MLYIIQCDPKVPPGFLSEFLDAQGVPHRVVRCDEGQPLPEPDLAGAVVMLGGNMGARDLAEFPIIGELRSFLKAAAEGGAAILGICLGGQMLADVLGGILKSSHRGEKGVGRVKLTPLGCMDPLFHNLPYDFVTYQWHSDSFDIPDSAVLLATNGPCPNQAFRFDARVYGLQFHPEVTPEIVESWAEGDNGHVVDFARVAREYRETGETLFRNFLRIADAC